MSADGEERYGGKPWVWGGKTYLLAPIGLGSLERAISSTQRISSGTLTADEVKEEMKKVIIRSLRRNYPSMTDEFINEEILDLSNIKELYGLALAASGLVQQGKTEAGSPPA